MDKLRASLNNDTTFSKLSVNIDNMASQLQPNLNLLRAKKLYNILNKSNDTSEAFPSCRQKSTETNSPPKRVKPWPNGVASSRKLKTWVYLRLRLARPCVHLRWLAMACAHFGRDQICTKVDASFSPFGHPTQVNASWVTSVNLLANKIEDNEKFKNDAWHYKNSKKLMKNS